jgi:hypothetical protein
MTRSFSQSAFALVATVFAAGLALAAALPVMPVA